MLVCERAVSYRFEIGHGNDIRTVIFSVPESTLGGFADDVCPSIRGIYIEGYAVNKSVSVTRMGLIRPLLSYAGRCVISCKKVTLKSPSSAVSVNFTCAKSLSPCSSMLAIGPSTYGLQIVIVALVGF